MFSILFFGNTLIESRSLQEIFFYLETLEQRSNKYYLYQDDTAVAFISVYSKGDYDIVPITGED